MSRRRLLVVLGAVVIVAAAVITTLVVRAQHTTRGQGSVDAVLRASVAALSAGDLDRLVALADPVGMFELAVTCGGDRDDDDDDDRHESDRDGEAREESARRVAGRDPQTILARTRPDFGPLVAAAKGRRIELVAIRSSETSDVPRGAPMMAGC